MVSGKPTNMPRSNKHQDGARYLHQRRRTVGSGVIAQFFGRKIAEYEHDDLQPQPECGELGPLFCSSGVTVREKSTTMSQSEKDLDGKRPLRRNRSSVGPGVITRCLRWKIAKCECHVHQPQPECAERPLAFSSAKMELTISTDTQSSQTLIPTSVTRTLCLWKDEDSEFHLTVFREDKDEVFLDLPLSGVLTRKINYDHSHDLWHKVTICESRSQQQRRLVFQLLNTSPDEVKDFNEKLNGVFEKILSTHTEEKEEGEKGWLAQEGRENPAIQYEEGPETRAEVALMQSMSSVSLLAMATSKPHGPSLGTETSSVATGDFSSGLSVMRPYDPLPEITAQQVSVDLAAAIQAGNVKKAQELASVLAQNHTLVSVSFDAAMQERKAREQEISVAVHVEDRESAGLILNAVKVRPSDTIHDLKLSFLGKYGFPPEVQKWIIGKRICKDEETLSKCEVNCSGHTLYLYLLNARAVNISREEYKRQWHSHAAPGAAVTSGSSMKQGQESGVYQSMHLPTGPPLAMVQTPTSSSQHSAFAPSQDQLGGTMRQQSQLSSPSSSSSLTPVSHSLTDLQGNLDPGAEPTSGLRGADSGQGQGQGGTLVAAVAGQSVLMTSGGGGEGRHQLQQPPEATPPEEQELSPQGWQCESCTLINQPTRPGCEACGSPRPANYRVPEGYVVSEEERQRLMREQQLEALMQQTSGQTGSHGRGQGGATNPHLPPNPSSSATDEKLTSEQLDLILRFNDAIQQHLSTAGDARSADSSVDPHDPLQMGRHSQLAPSGVRQPVQNTRQPTQNVELGEDVPDNANINALLGWVSEEEEFSFA